MLRPLARRLKDPPIVEVVCGFFFSQLELDAIVVGKYWSERKEDQGYGRHQLQPAVSDRPGLSLSEGIGPLRCWLIKDTDEYVLQIQADRFYFNWRKRQGGYPHFADHDGADGVLTKSIREFEEFKEFCASVLKQEPTPTRFELTKVDLLVSPGHWKDYADLTIVLPSLGKLPQIADEPSLSISLGGQRDGFQVHFGLTNVVLAEDMSAAVKIETRVSAAASSDIRATMSAMNETANQIFFGMLNETALRRFGGLIE